MIADSLIVPECVFRPRSFTGLMTLYESNYIKLSNLVSEYGEFPTSLPAISVSRSATDCDLYLELQRAERYTTTLQMTYLFPPEAPSGDDSTPVANPDLTIRVYHDARLVEAVRARDEHHHHKLQELARAHSQELDRRWRNNMLLNKWLDFLLDMGHGFVLQATD